MADITHIPTDEGWFFLADSKSQYGVVEAMRIVSVARRNAVKARTQGINQLRALLVSAPDTIREKLWNTKAEQCIQNCARFRILGETPLLQTLASTLRLLANAGYTWLPS